MYMMAKHIPITTTSQLRIIGVALLHMIRGSCVSSGHLEQGYTAIVAFIIDGPVLCFDAITKLLRYETITKCPRYGTITKGLRRGTITNPEKSCTCMHVDLIEVQYFE